MSATPTRVELHSASEEQTKAIGRRLSKSLLPGTLVALDGDLGSGKTRFVQGMAEGLGIASDEVSSPTFVLCHIYAGDLTLLHVDAYRLKALDEVPDLGISEALDEGSIVVIEWAGRISAALPTDFIHVQIDEMDPNTRRVVVESHGPNSQQILTRW